MEVAWASLNLQEALGATSIMFLAGKFWLTSHSPLGRSSSCQPPREGGGGILGKMVSWVSPEAQQRQRLVPKFIWEVAPGGPSGRMRK